MDKSYQDINAETIDRWVAGGWEWGRPITHEVFEAARRGTWDVLLTPTHAAPLPVCFRAARRAAAPEPVSLPESPRRAICPLQDGRLVYAGAYLTARRIASFRLTGLAAPVPAMSNAVP